MTYSDAELRGLLADLLDNARHRNKIVGITGKVQSDGSTLTLNEGLTAGYVWVRTPDNRQTYAVRGWVNFLNVGVVIGKNLGGEWEIIEGDAAYNAQVYGSAGGAVTTPVQPPGYFTGVVDDYQFNPALVTLSSLGGLYVRVNPFFYFKGYYAGGDVLLVPTATASRKSWCVLSFNTADGTVNQTLGTDQTLAYTLLASEIASISVPGDVLLAGVTLENGQTTIASTNIYSARAFVESVNILRRILTSGGDVLTSGGEVLWS